ncbi:MAG: murein biosynthesis integral membrane protein MurJ [Proteobacteria bacterium]|nr:murein biosynthesis integral membrane protein MurJ [Pseudomonadota bacterium]
MAQTHRAFSFGLGTLLSRVSGLAREMILARFFGASVLLDAYFVAYRIPNLFRDLLAEGALGSAFTKNYVQLRDISKNKALALLTHVLCFAFLITSLLCSLGIIYRKSIVYLLTTLSTADSLPLIQTTETVAAILFPLMILSSLSAVMSGVLYQEKKFFISSLSPVLLNGSIIITVLFLSSYIHEIFSFLPLINSLDPKLAALSVATLLGGLGQLLWLTAPLCKRLLGYFFCKHFLKSLLKPLNHHQALMATIKESLPMMAAASVAQLSLIINTNFATSLEIGSVSWLSFAFRLIQLPVGLFAVAIATVILPALARELHSQKASHSNTHNSSQAIEEMQQGLKWTFFLMLACSVVILLEGRSIITLLFYGGAFDNTDLLMTEKALTAYSFGIIGYGISKVLLSYIYAASLTNYALKVAVLCLIISVTLNALWIDKWGIITLAGVSAAVFSLQALLLGYKCYSSLASTATKLTPIFALTKSIAIYLSAASLCALMYVFLKTFSSLLHPLKEENFPNNATAMEWKWAAFYNLSILGCIVFVVFFLGLCIEYKSTPKTILSKLRLSGLKLSKHNQGSVVQKRVTHHTKKNKDKQ